MAFFDDVEKMFYNMEQDVSHSTRKYGETEYLNQVVREKNEEIRNLLVTVGYAYYNSHKDDTGALEYENMQKLKNLFDELEKTDSELKRRMGYRQCSCCKAYVAPGAVFCVSCGTNISNEGCASFCVNCGNPLPEGAVFCTGCGTKIG